MMVVLLILAILYTCWILYLLKGWRSIETKPLSAALPTQGISLVIAFRNEAHRLGCLLRTLSKQDYPVSLLEVILVNDHSEDLFEPTIESFSDFPFTLRVLSLEQGKSGKKQAIAYGVSQAAQPWILTTDADCTAGTHWVKSMMQHAEAAEATFVFGPVAFESDRSFLTDFQQMELASLIGSGASLWKKGFPTMCNGANLLYKKSLLTYDPYQSNQHLASGDDEFLMHQVYQREPQAVSFAKNKESLVMTEPCYSWPVLYQQRKRWASKWGAYRLVHVQRIALGVFLANLCYAVLPLLALGWPVLIPWIIGIYGCRWIMDGIFIREITRFYNKPFNLVRYAEVATIYPLYVVVSALAGRAGKYTWKGRKVS
ncbi:MAG: glycosyl transferase family 2 [Cytophagaceae bacterium]|jgi:cellulose synthase/poly-beta-1,6-N-acetylglucosamine synthase-like glycosyltransferase|nr:glycosyl transferase family 2 [Cytophagaceae bacterium]